MMSKKIQGRGCSLGGELSAPPNGARGREMPAAAEDHIS
jgi:hypothetical protein